MNDRPVIFIRLAEDEQWIKQALETQAWTKKTTLNKYLREILRQLAGSDINKRCDHCPVNHEQDTTLPILDTVRQSSEQEMARSECQGRIKKTVGKKP